MNTENIFKLVVIFFIFYFLFKINTEKFNVTPTACSLDDIKNKIKVVFDADVESIRVLSTLANTLNTNPDGITVPGNTKFVGSISTNNLLPSDMPSGWSGIRTRDIFADGTIITGVLGANNVFTSSSSMNRDGSINCSTLNVGNASITNNTINCVNITNTTGTITCANLTATTTVTCGNINITSDYRIKDNVNEVINNDNFNKLRPVTYFNKISNKNEIGFIAHEVQELYPELVTGIKDGDDNQSVNYIGLIPLLVNEIKELKLINDEFKKEINIIEEKINI
jgi:hypothetical protein